MTTSLPLRLLPALAGLCLLSGACSLSVEADIPEVEVTQRGVEFEGVPLGDKLGVVAISTSFELMPSKLAWAKELNSQIHVRKVLLRATGGLADLDFIKIARVSMACAGDLESEIDVIDYQRPDNAPSSKEIDAATRQPIDVTKLWSSKSTRISVQVAGNLPVQPWAVDISLGMGGKITYEY